QGQGQGGRSGTGDRTHRPRRGSPVYRVRRAPGRQQAAERVRRLVLVDQRLRDVLRGESHVARAVRERRPVQSDASGGGLWVGELAAVERKQPRLSALLLGSGCL